MVPGRGGGNEISQGQIWRCATWSFVFSIFCYVSLTSWTRRTTTASRSARRPSFCHFACRLWTSTFLGFATGLGKEVMDGMDVDWPWCGPNGLENPCRFQTRVVLVYYESAVVAMILLIAVSMTRAYLHDRRLNQPPPCDDTVAMSVDLEFDDVEDGCVGETDKAPTETTDSLSPHCSYRSATSSILSDDVIMWDGEAPGSHCPPDPDQEVSGEASVPLDNENNVAAPVVEEDHDDVGGSLDDGDDRAPSVVGEEQQQLQQQQLDVDTPNTTSTTSAPLDKDEDAADAVAHKDAPRIVGELLADAEEGNSAVCTGSDTGVPIVDKNDK